MKILNLPEQTIQLPLDKYGQIIVPYDILRTPEGTYCTFKHGEHGSDEVIRYQDCDFFNNCVRVSNIKDYPHFFEEDEK